MRTKVSIESITVDSDDCYLVILYFESGKVEVRSVYSLEEAAELRSSAASGMSALLSATIFVRLP